MSAVTWSSTIALSVWPSERRLMHPSLTPFLAGSTSLLAELMLPDGVHQRAEDWTVFYLNQTQATAVRSELTEESVRGAEDTPGPANASTTSGNDGLLYTISLVRTKHGSAYKR